METKLLIEIHNRSDIPLARLTLSLLSVAEQFGRFLDRYGIEVDKNAEALHLKNIKYGSVIVELTPCIAYALPLLQDFNTILEFVSYLKKTFEYFLGKADQKPIDYEKKDLQQLHECLNPIANDSGSQINFIAREGASQVVNVTINCMEANAAQNKIRKELETLTEEKQSKYNKQLLTWFQARFSMDSKTGDMAIIENISKKPIKVIFENPLIKQDIINTKGFSKSWQDLAYIVDVEVMYIKNVVRRYKIVNFYPEETFDPESE